MKTDGVGGRIFLSFSSVDRNIAYEINSHLRSKGFGTWFLSSAKPSQSIRDELERGLMSAETYVVLLSASSISSPWVMFEIGAAVGQGKQILPVIVSRIAPRDLPSVLAGMQMIDAAGKDPESIATRIAQAVAGVGRQDGD